MAFRTPKKKANKHTASYYCEIACSNWDGSCSTNTATCWFWILPAKKVLNNSTYTSGVSILGACVLVMVFRWCSDADGVGCQQGMWTSTSGVAQSKRALSHKQEGEKERARHVECMLLSMYLHVLYNHLFMATLAQTNAGLEPSVNYRKKSVQPTSEHYTVNKQLSRWESTQVKLLVFWCGSGALPDRGTPYNRRIQSKWLRPQHPQQHSQMQNCKHQRKMMKKQKDGLQCQETCNTYSSTYAAAQQLPLWGNKESLETTTVSRTSESYTKGFHYLLVWGVKATWLHCWNQSLRSKRVFYSRSMR